MVNQIRVFLKLLLDKRVHPLIKALPFLALFYLILFPDLLVGPFDDAGVIAILMKLFYVLVPDELIEDLKSEQDNQAGSPGNEDTIIEGEFWEE